MANLVDTPSWDSVLELGLDTRVRGGPGGESNMQAQALANRTADLRSNVGRSLVNFGGVSGGADCTAALLAAFQSGESIYLPRGQWHIKSTLEFSGPIHLHGPGTLVMDAINIYISNGPQSVVEGIGLDTESTPWMLQRWNAAGQRIAPVMVQSKTANGYQWTVNDLDFTPPANQRTQLSAGFVFINSDNVTVRSVRSTFGMCFYFYDCSYCSVERVRGPMGWGRNQGGIYFGSVNPLVDKPNYGNEAFDCIVTGSSFSGIQFSNSRFPKARGNQILYVGESGIKTGQNDGTPNNQFAHCFDGTFDGNTVFRPHYDGYDISQNYPHTAVEDARHTLTNNTAIETDGCGFYLDGSFLNIDGNRAYGCYKSGFLIDTNDSKIKNLEARGCNTGLFSNGQHQISIAGNDNIIENSTGRRSAAAAVGYNGYIQGARNRVINNDGRDTINDAGSMFYCGAATATYSKNNRRGDIAAAPSAGDAAERHEAPGGADNQVTTRYKVRDALTNDIAQQRVILDNGTNGAEGGGYAIDVAKDGSMRQGLRLSAGGDFGAQLAMPLVDAAALNHTLIPPGQTGIIWSINQGNGVLTATIKFSDGNTRKLDFLPA